MSETISRIDPYGNEEKANRIVAKICVALSVFLLAYYLMVWSHVFEVTDHNWMYNWMLVCSVVLMAAIAVYCFSDGKSWWVR